MTTSKLIRFILGIFVAAACSTTTFAQAPADYYANVVTDDSAALRESLHEIIDDHTRIPYTSSSLDTWDVLELVS